MKPELVILTTHFGDNFSGGSSATCEIFGRIENEFSGVTVIGTVIGEHGLNSPDFIPIRCLADATRFLRHYYRPGMILYGDFYNALAFQHCGLPFFFTYHDNWPENTQVEGADSIQSRWHWSAYQAIFRAARHVFTVSEYKHRQVQHYTDAVSLVRNGISVKEQGRFTGQPANILMVGNIDQRKYGKALKVFSHLVEHYGWLETSPRIDIYGHAHDQRLLEQLIQFPFVRYLGFHSTIEYSRYRVCLHTSAMENLSLVWCEAIASGTPVLTFDVGGAGEVVNEQTGAMVDAYDIDQMCAELQKLLTSGKRVDGRSVRELCSWDTAAQRYLTTLLCSGPTQ